MDEFVLIPHSLWNNFLNNHSDKPPQKQVFTKPTQSPSSIPATPISDTDATFKRLSSGQTKFYLNNKKDIIKALLESDRIDLSPRDTIILDSVDSGIAVKDFAEKLSKDSAPGTLPQIYHSILGVLSLPVTKIRNQDAIKSGHGEWLSPFRK